MGSLGRQYSSWTPIESAQAVSDHAQSKYTSTREGTTFKLPFWDRYFRNACSIYTDVARMWKMLIGVGWQERKPCYNKRTLNPGMCAKSKTIQSILPLPCHSHPSGEKVIWFIHSTEIKINMLGRSHHWDSLAAFQSTYALLWLLQEGTKSFSTEVEMSLTMNLIPWRLSINVF